MFIIREVGKGYGLFRTTEISLLGISDNIDSLSNILCQAICDCDDSIKSRQDCCKNPINSFIKPNDEKATIKIPNDSSNCYKKSEMPCNSVTSKLNADIKVDGIKVTATYKDKTVNVGLEYSDDVTENIKHAVELLFDKEDTKSWLAVGKPYYYVVAPSPLYAAVNKGIIDQDILDELQDSDELGNIFRTREEAVVVAKKMSKLFERE